MRCVGRTHDDACSRTIVNGISSRVGMHARGLPCCHCLMSSSFRLSYEVLNTHHIKPKVHIEPGSFTYACPCCRNQEIQARDEIHRLSTHVAEFAVA